MSFESAILSYSNKYKLFSPSEKVLVGVSGGIDSMSLLHFLQRCELTIAVAHCNFQLREEANSDEAFVAAYCQANNITFYSRKFETESFANTHKISIQMAARELRFEWFEHLAVSQGFKKIALGTHATDQVETMLINQVRGTGIAGLHGISPKNGKIIRPFLSTTREKIEAYASENQIEFVHDKSNDQTYYLRNDIRKNVLPLLKKWNPKLEQTFGSNATQILQAERFLTECIEEKTKAFIQDKNNNKLILKKTILESSHAQLFLHHLLSPFQFTKEEQENLIANGKEFGFKLQNRLHELVVERDEIIIQRLQASFESFTIEKAPFSIQTPFELSIFKREWESNTPFPNSRFKEILDAKKVVFPLLLRPWKDGDKMIPFGMNGSKLISDILTDNKVPLHKRKKYLVLESNGKIAWLIGLRASHEFRVDQHTKKTLVFEIDKTVYH